MIDYRSTLVYVVIIIGEVAPGDEGLIALNVIDIVLGLGLDI